MVTDTTKDFYSLQTPDRSCFFFTHPTTPHFGRTVVAASYYLDEPVYVWRRSGVSDPGVIMSHSH